MTSTSREEAKALIQELATENGWLSAEDREYLRVNRPHIIKSVDGARRLACASTEALSRNLYSKDTRFVYELIQNAEDNKYSIANGNKERPHLSFTVSAKRIIIDSNEDGFSEANTRAICRVGESTKSGIEGYVGEKGIGFKSVFKVACKVHVQSEPYSFAFEYNRGLPDSGLGMVTPLVEPPDELLGVRTRIILHLNDRVDKDALLREFEALPDTLLLFLRKLKKLSIRIERHEKIVSKVYELSIENNRACIARTIKHDTVNLNYWIASKSITNMPEEEARTGITTADVFLAFPLNQDDVPTVEEQHVFAFLPLRKVGFKFLIQSDFITQASREDVSNCPWNRRILDEIVNLFLETTTSGFLDQPTLKYSWLRYLATNGVPDEFWGTLQSRLFSQLMDHSCFIPLGDRGTTLARSLRLVPTSLRDFENRPLLSECDCTTPHLHSRYVSDKYDATLDIPILRKLGLETLSTAEFIGLLRCDLKPNGYSRLRTTPAESRWHTYLSRSLLRAVATSEQLAIGIKKLPLVPLLKDERWVPSFNASIYFPKCRGIDIPRDLPLSLVDSRALINDERTELFRELGVSECAPQRIFPLLEQACRKDDWTMDTALDHLKFVFWNHTDLPSQGQRISLMVVSKDLLKQVPDLSTRWWYSPSSTDPCSAANVIGHPVPKQLKGEIQFLHPRYYEVFGACERRYDKSGIEWLEEFIQVKSIPEPRIRAGAAIAEEFKYLATQKAHSIVLGVLKRQWSHVDFDIPWKADFQKLARVPILHSDDLSPLSSTYLPLPKLKAIVDRLELQSGFGFIKELDGMEDDGVSDWSFLRHLGVQYEEDFCFWLLLLKKAREKKNPGYIVMSEIYSRLLGFCSTPSHKTTLRTIFGAIEGPSMFGGMQCSFLFLPANTRELFECSSERNYIFTREDTWCYPSFCRWNTPTWYTHHPNLARLPGYESLKTFFVDGLSVPTDPGVDDYLSYISYLKNPNRVARRDQILKLLYNKLHSEIRGDNAWKESIKSRFESDKLIYNFQDQMWHSPSTCVWVNDTVRLPEKFSIATEYSAQKPFFLTVLGIEEPKLPLYIQALKREASKSPSSDSIKQLIRNICQFSPTAGDLAMVFDSKCFPVRLPDGTLAWMNGKEDFAIVDRQEYETLFRGELKTLDFSKEEVHEMEAFLIGLGLRNRYLSGTVAAETTASRSSIDHSMTTKLRRKAYAICRYAAHARCTTARDDPAECFKKLQNITVLISEEFSKTLTTYQDGRPVTMVSGKAYCHLEDVDNEDSNVESNEGGGLENSAGLKVYIPRDPRLRYRCLLTHLPQAILNHFGAPNSYVGELGSIFSAHGLADVDEILENAGVISVACVNRPEDVELDSSEPEEDDGDPTFQLPDDTGEIGPVIPPRPTFLEQAQLAFRPSSTSSSHFISQRSSGLSPGSNLTPPTSVFSTPDTQEDPTRYTMLLEVAVDSARRGPPFPRVGETSAVSLEPCFSKFEVDVAVAGTQRDFKVGAAGELFMFEWLKSLQLPNFGLENIVYEDHKSKFTGLLVANGYLRSDLWAGKQPKYHIEVKASTCRLTTPLYVGRNQYELMIDTTLPIESASDRVYILARVFNLGQSDMGLKLYLDPNRLEREGRLRFRSDKYEVTEAA
ncbi:hypothetical protein P152DRAFT_475063 [Eremomyces bilateralis CBS 781.70]|uniref:Protein NO VEIN C-terminal domain-containing protein n=1 Tax=Eremomyces bilateralis CBS 781.70 TaxID=1392243 RepID=A0A6G1FZA3_9PEZI|nr:uncharacterized protein P152DRAFT_475063 [Eremomyces bilateralis CBS 781.70]KAF1811006.1 hypothetical protein P152DRAFT_475063 [Eremomyces bilateralis CBS 781.70]